MELFKTERLTVRSFEESDAPLCRFYSDPDVMRFIETPFTPAQTLDFIRLCGVGDAPKVWAVTEAGRIIGHLIWHRFETDDVFELGWILDKSCWGRGVASELTRRCIELARKNGLSAVVCEAVPENEASVAVMKKCGFIYEGIFDGLVRYIYRV